MCHTCLPCCKSAPSLPHRLKDGLKDVDLYNHHGRLLMATTCENGTCQVWDTEQAIELCQLQIPKGEPFTAQNIELINRQMYSKLAELCLCWPHRGYRLTCAHLLKLCLTNTPAAQSPCLQV